MRILILLFSLFLFPSLLSSQVVDSIEQVTPDPVVVDSLEQADAAVKVKSKFIPKPNRTLMWSLLPAGGQIYNRRWWKVPLVYGAFVGLGFAIDYNQNLYRDLRDAYLLALDDQPHQFSGTTIDSPNALRNLRDSFDKNTQTAYVGIIILYALQSMEAYVDSHLRSFDVNDDLSFKLKPALDVNGLTGQPVMGIGISIPLGR